VLGASRNGLSAAIGSALKTSTAAPPRCPSRNATASAASSTIPPRATFSRMAPRFMAWICASPISPRVCAVSGT
jgi:hypothetical protein